MTDSSPPLLSAIVLTYNHEKYIAACVKGLLGVDYANVEICVLDDGSTDSTFAIVHNFVGKTQHPILLKTQAQSGGRISENTQKLVEMARGKYLLFMSGDDILAPDFAITNTIDQMERDEKITMAFARVVHFTMGNCSRLSTVYTPSFRALLQSGNPEKIYSDYLCKRVSRLFLQGTIVRRSFIDEIGGFDTTVLADDYAFMVRAFKAMQGQGNKIVFNEDSLCLYREHDANIHRNLNRQRDLVAQVVAKYIPSQYWPAFIMDYGVPRSYDDFLGIDEHLHRYFGPAAEKQMIQTVAKDYLRWLLKEKDLGTLKKVLLWDKTRWDTRLYALRMSYLFIFSFVVPRSITRKLRWIES
jgi:glycosyltransferase involved in cell wall biosynthesis